jgi:beta-lactam-binding protein with PASTA domain
VTETATVTETVTASPEPSTSTSSTPAPGSGGDDDAMITVPDGVGQNYQQAQDLWRGVGLHVMPAKDATGANRLPFIDSNWVVLSQKPKAGTKVRVDSTITATVKKYTDD